MKIENYFKNANKKYYEPKYLITILENIYGKNFAEIKKEISQLNVTVSEEQIENFLDEKFEIEEPELKKRIEDSQKVKTNETENRTKPWSSDDLEASSQEFEDNLIASRYSFEPYTLEYFKKYTAILQKKLLNLLNIIEKLGNNEENLIQEQLLGLDITLDADGNISKIDIIRLITPTLYNIDKLKEKIAQANELETYLTLKMSLLDLKRRGLSESELYPGSALQIKNLYDDFDNKGNIPLSPSQRKDLSEEQIKNIVAGTKIILSLGK